MAHDHALPGSLPAQDAAAITRNVARLSVATAIVLIGLKLWAWMASGSVAMLSSLADSGLDGMASLFTLVAVSYAALPPDEEHRYGHGKAESFAAMVQAVLVGVSATLVAMEAVARFSDPQPIAESKLALAVMGISIALTLALVWAQTRAVRQTGSVATAGDRAHYAADLAANGAVIVGISLAAYSGLQWADPAVGLLVAGWLAWSAMDVARGGWDQLLDHELPDEARARIRTLALSTGGLLDVHQLRTRASGPYVHIQFHADMPKGITLVDAHQRMVAAEQAIVAEFPSADVLIHPDPRGAAEPHGSEPFNEGADE
ncbi:MAG: cation diffusion facilitator family transporter [Pseudomonadota bacterium]